MADQILIGSVMIILTTIIHAIGMMVGLKMFMFAYYHRVGLSTVLTRALLMAGLILILFFATTIEAALWAGAYLSVGALESYDTAIYFSMVAYTTLGFGDVVLDDQWRFLSSIEAANGIIMFAWTTAIIVVAINHISRSLQKLEQLKRRE